MDSQMDNQIGTFEGEAPATEAQTGATETGAPGTGPGTGTETATTVTQVAQAAAIPAPPVGAQQTIEVVPGARYTFDFPRDAVEFVLNQDGDLVILVAGGGEIILAGFDEHFNEIPPLDFAGEPVAALDLLTEVATAEQLAEIAPAAGPAAGPVGNTGAVFDPFDPGPLPASIDDLGPLGPTALAFPFPELAEEFFPSDAVAGLPPIEMKIPEVPDNGEECGINLAEMAEEYIETFLDVFGPITAVAGALVVDAPGQKVGDFFVASTSDISETLHTDVPAPGADGTVFSAGNDILDGRLDGPSVLVGDVFLNQLSDESDIDLDLDVTSVVIASHGNTVDFGNDVIGGGAGNDTIVGDLFMQAPSSNEMDLEANVESLVFGGDDNTFRADNDVVRAGGGDDVVVGDLYMFVGGSSEMDASLTVTSGVFGGEGNLFSMSNDALDGGDGDDTIVGDGFFFVGKSSSMDVDINVENTVVGGNGNRFYAFDDMITGGVGDDFIVGDFAFVGGSEATGMSSPIDADIYVSNTVIGFGGGQVPGGEGFFGGEGASNNVFDAFNDLLTSNDLNDTIIGDIFVDQYTVSDLDLTLDINNTVSGGPIPGGEGFAPADDNSFDVFNDIIDGDIGDELLVGDIYLLKQTSSETDIDIQLSNSVSWGEGNSFNAFNDAIRGQGGDDTMVGDVLIDDIAGNKNLSIDISNEVFGGEGNTFAAFNDTMIGGSGDDVMVGDLFLDDAGVGSGFELELSLHSQGGTAYVFDDHLCGGAGDDLLVGDVYRLGGGEGSSDPSVALTAGIGVGEDYDDGGGNGSGGNRVNAFNDTLTGDGGNDTLVGDIYAPTVDLAARAGDGGRGGGSDDGTGGDGGNHNRLDAFNDVLEGGDGDDVLVGDVYGYGGPRGAGISLLAGAGNGGDLGTLGGSSGAQVEARPGGSGGSGNTVEAFNDVITGGTGDDDLVGDVYGNGGGGISLLAEAGNGATGGSSDNAGDGGASNSVYAFNDTLDGGSGDDTVVGDVAASGGYVSLTAAAGNGGRGGDGSSGADGGEGGDNNTVNAFNDVLTGGLGNDELVGDVFAGYGGGKTSVTLLAAAGNAGDNGVGGSEQSGSVGGRGGRYNEVNAFNDTLDGGSGDDTVVGDVYAEPGGTRGGAISLKVEVGNGGAGDAQSDAGDGTKGGSDNSVRAFNDFLTGGAGEDKLVGDVYLAGGVAAASILLAIAAGNGGGLAVGTGGSSGGENIKEVPPGGDGGNDETVDAFNDSLTGDDGNDVLVGDVYVNNEGAALGSIALMVEAANGGDGGSSGIGGSGGNDQDIDAFNDTAGGGAGDDTLVGDVYAVGGGGSISLSIDVAHGGEGGFGSSGSRGGSGGDSGDYDVFNDVLTGGLGHDILVGDVYRDDSVGGGNAISLMAAVGLGGNGGGDNSGTGLDLGSGSGSNGGDGGNYNTVNAFNDVLTGGGGDDKLVGDVYGNYGGGGGTITLSALAGIGGDGGGSDGSPGGDGGNSNELNAFNDTLSGGDGEDVLVGDVYSTGGGTINLIARAGETGGGAGSGGSGTGGDGGNDNTVSAFNDFLEGGSGDDLLVGDVYATGGPTVDVTVGGSMGADVNAFGDTLLGGGGDDTLFGDFYDGAGAFTPDSLTVSGGDAFGDSLDGGLGNDLLNGGIGDDTMTGGGGNDTFQFSLGTDDGADRVLDLSSSDDILSFTDVVDSGDGGGITLTDLNALVSSFNDPGAGGDVTVTFTNGASIVFEGVGTGFMDSIDDLVDTAAQLVITG